MLRSILSRFAALMLVTGAASTAGADAIPSYTVTDLGAGNATLSAATGADATVTASDGKTVYAFPRTDNTVANPQSLLNTLPPITSATPPGLLVTYGNEPTYSQWSTNNNLVFLNQKGELLSTNFLGVDGQSALSGSIVYTATRLDGGFFGPLKPLWNSPNGIYGGGTVASVLDLNNAGQALGLDAGIDPHYNSLLGSRDVFLFDLHSGVRTELASLLPQGLSWPDPIALDDQGRILLRADKPDVPGVYHSQTELLLLTPAGLSSTPIATPEPSTLATLAVAGLGLAVHRRLRGRRIKGN